MLDDKFIKTYQGFNVDELKSGMAVYVHLEDAEGYIVREGNALIKRVNAIEMTLVTIEDLRNGTQLTLNIDDIIFERIKVQEFRVLK